MTTRDFIARRYAVPGKEQWCSSVFADESGNIYSYGYHYPLAFRVRGLDFVNTAGYSNTTAKHMNWAWSAVGYHAIGVKLGRDDVHVFTGGYDDEVKFDRLTLALSREQQDLVRQMAVKKRKDTLVYQLLQHDHDRVLASLQQLCGVPV